MPDEKGLPMRYVMIVLMLAGCATPADLREAGPPIEWKSAKPADETAGCIASNADEFRSLGFAVGSASVRPLGKGAFDVHYHMGGEDLIFTARVEPGPIGSTVRLWANPRPLFRKGELLESARRGCE
jgi:hypothetical protein